MLYELKEPISVRNFRIWSYVFASVSLFEFNTIADKLSFPLHIPEIVRQVAQDFTIASQRIFSFTCSFEPEVNLLEGVQDEEPFGEKAKIVFARTFSRLEILGFAKLIYQWGITTHDAYPPRHIDALHSWYNLLFLWAILEVHNGSALSGLMDSEAMKRVLDRHASTLYEKVAKPHELTLPTPTKNQLQATLLTYEDKFLTYEVLLKQILASLANPWADYALRYVPATYSWLRSEGRFRWHLEEWHKVKNLLSASEIMILEEWARQHTTYPYRHLITPMPTFENNL